mmetsp:Transcript_19552/g.77804  ORF Transcript_19552/g.77804 Transcript_19552/m.77804 type:complete len:531 (-) Transcript_19552:421-2013(-)
MGPQLLLRGDGRRLPVGFLGNVRRGRRRSAGGGGVRGFSGGLLRRLGSLLVCFPARPLDVGRLAADRGARAGDRADEVAEWPAAEPRVGVRRELVGAPNRVRRDGGGAEAARRGFPRELVAQRPRQGRRLVRDGPRITPRKLGRAAVRETRRKLREELVRRVRRDDDPLAHGEGFGDGGAEDLGDRGVDEDSIRGAQSVVAAAEEARVDLGLAKARLDGRAVGAVADDVEPTPGQGAGVVVARRLGEELAEPIEPLLPEHLADEVRARGEVLGAVVGDGEMRDDGGGVVFVVVVECFDAARRRVGPRFGRFSFERLLVGLIFRRGEEQFGQKGRRRRFVVADGEERVADAVDVADDVVIRQARQRRRELDDAVAVRVAHPPSETQRGHRFQGPRDGVHELPQWPRERAFRQRISSVIGVRDADDVVEPAPRRPVAVAVRVPVEVFRFLEHHRRRDPRHVLVLRFGERVPRDGRSLVEHLARFAHRIQRVVRRVQLGVVERDSQVRRRLGQPAVRREPLEHVPRVGLARRE